MTNCQCLTSIFFLRTTWVRRMFTSWRGSSPLDWWTLTQTTSTTWKCTETCMEDEPTLGEKRITLRKGEQTLRRCSGTREIGLRVFSSEFWMIGLWSCSFKPSKCWWIESARLVQACDEKSDRSGAPVLSRGCCDCFVYYWIMDLIMWRK